MRMRRLLVALLVAACANPYQQFYKGVPDARISPSYVTDTTPLQIYSTNDFNRDGLELIRRGYWPVGQSSFNAGVNKVKESQLREQATRIGAHVVLVSSQYTHSVSGAIPLTIPTTSTTTSSGNATAYGASGSVTVSGTGTSTTTSSRTIVLPYTIARADFGALYFARTRSRLGLYVRALDDSTRLRLQTNSGVRVIVVIEKSPAFEADILPGDVLLDFNGDRVHSEESYSQLLDKYQGSTVILHLDRAGERVQKQVGILR